MNSKRHFTSQQHSQIIICTWQLSWRQTLQVWKKNVWCWWISLVKYSSRATEKIHTTVTPTYQIMTLKMLIAWDTSMKEKKVDTQILLQMLEIHDFLCNTYFNLSWHFFQMLQVEKMASVFFFFFLKDENMLID